MNTLNQSDLSQNSKMQHSWMTSYKVNFKRFVRTVLEKDLMELSKQDDFFAALLSPFTASTSHEYFLSNTEKHFRMQFVIELVSALIHCLQHSFSKRKHNKSF